MLFKLKFIKNVLLTFIVFLFGFSYLGLEQKTSAWSSVSELENRGNQIISSYHDLICQSIIYENSNCPDAFLSFIESLEAENETDEKLIFGTPDKFDFHPICYPLLKIFYNYRDQIYQKLNQQQIPLQKADPQPTQNGSSSDPAKVSNLEQTDSDWKTHIADLKKSFTTIWLANNPNLDQTSDKFRKAWRREYLKAYRKIPT